jgi:hypothetical protein
MNHTVSGLAAGSQANWGKPAAISEVSNRDDGLHIASDVPAPFEVLAAGRPTPRYASHCAVTAAAVRLVKGGRRDASYPKDKVPPPRPPPPKEGSSCLLSSSSSLDGQRSI